MKKGSLYELDLLEGPQWSMMLPEAKLVSLVHAATPGHYMPESHVDECSLCH